VKINKITLLKKRFFLNFFFILNLLSFFEGPPDRLAEALVFTWELKSGFRA
jgi:hypothetical protein